jgi:hypothetical protein
MDMFKDFFGMPSTYGAIDVMQIHVQKLKPHFLQLTITLSNPKVTTFKCKLLWTIGNGFEMCMLGFQVLSKMHESSCYFLIPQSPKEICLLLTMDKKI